MNRCARCRHFGPPDPISYFDWDADDGEEEIESGHHRCERVMHGNAGGRETAERLTEPAVVVDGSGYVAVLRVLPSFGCILWEERDR